MKLANRIVIPQALTVTSPDCAYLGSYAEPRLQDADRAIHSLDGKAAPTRQHGLCAAMHEALQSSPVRWEVQTEYWRAKMFRNGSVHLFPRRPELLRNAE